MPNWTREQLMAIQARNHTVLVSAAAGSGKTAVLVERIVRLIREKFRLNRMLIVTFTRAAAGEMRQRLAQRLMNELSADPETFSQALDDLENTDISTIHAFCQHVLRQEFQAAGIDPMARVCEEQRRELLFETAFRSAMNELLERADDESFLRLTRGFSQQSLLKISQELYQFLMSMPNPFEWLSEKTECIDAFPIKEHPWYQMLVKNVRLEVMGLSSYLYAMRKLLDEPDAVDAFQELLNSDEQQIELLRAVCTDEPEEMSAALRRVSFARAPVCKGLSGEQKAWKDRYGKLRDEMKKAVKQAEASLNVDETAVANDLRTVADEAKGMRALITSIHQHFLDAKNKENVVDFSDLEQMTLNVLRQPECRRQLQQQYDHIFVDECQDVSAVQDAIVQAVHGEESCLFMVGDVKQSIYRFRLADPTLFLKRMRSFSDDEKARERRIFLQKNFRSREKVLDATNRVFRQAMREEVTELNYLPEDELICGRETEDDPKVEIRLIDQPDGRANGSECLESEAAIVAAQIRKLLETECTDGTEKRKYQYRDMVILLQKMAGVGEKLAGLLQAQGIPVYFDGADHYFSLPEIRVMKALLTVIDNPMQDVPLLTALKNLPFRMTDSELSDIRICKTGKNVPFWQAFDACCEKDGEVAKKCLAAKNRLAEWRFLQENMQLSDFVWRLMTESGIYAACGAYPEGELRQANLRLLRQKAAVYEQSQSGGLSGFLKLIDLQMTLGDSTGAKVLGENENLVRIMTMHKSKGLEFPIVFCMRLTAGMGSQQASPIKLHGRLGLCLPYTNGEMNIRRATIGDAAFQFQKRLDEMAERCRLLYVAMTRARDRLILTGCAQRGEKNNWRMPRGDYRVWSTSAMMDWVMQAALEDEDNPPWQIIWEETAQSGAQARESASRDMAEWLGIVLSRQPGQSVWDQWSGEVRRTVDPIKTSVSSLTRRQTLHDPMPLGGEDEEMEDKRAPEDITAPLRLSELPDRPAFMEVKRMTGAERGTLIHQFLSLTSLEALKHQTGSSLIDALAAEADRLIRKGCLPENGLNVIDYAHIRAFYESGLGARMLASGEVRREWGFNLRISREKGTLVQGIIDCAFMEDGEWVLVDYKTDRIANEEAFVERHSMQMRWYARALEEITGRRVKEKWLYSLGLSKSFRVE